MNYLKEKLNEQNMTQKELAIRCDVSFTTISRLCNDKNKRGASIDLAYNISKILDIPIEEFIKNI